MSTLSVNTNHNGNIKSEPVSPPRDAHTPSSQHMRPPSTGHMPGHLSPGQLSNHSNSSSPAGSISNDFDGPVAKRSRILSEQWTAS